MCKNKKNNNNNKKNRRHGLQILFGGSAQYTSYIHIVGNAYASTITEVKAPFVCGKFSAIKRFNDKKKQKNKQRHKATSISISKIIKTKLYYNNKCIRT